MPAAQWSDGAAGPVLRLADDGSWRDLAGCAGAGDDFFPYPGQRAGMQLAACARCPVKGECLDYVMAMESGLGRQLRHGIWAGLFPGERWQMDRSARKAAA